MAIRPIQNEEEILAKIAKGDEYAFTQLFNWYYEPLGQLILVLTESVTLTQDIIQDAFVKIWLRREMLSKIENFNGYLFILCRNLTFDILKKMAKARKMEPAVKQHLQWDAELDYLDNPSEHYRNLIHYAVDKLPPQQQKIYQLSRYERFKYEEIAERMGLSAETVKTQIYNAVKFIRKELSDQATSGCIVIVLTSILAANK